MLGLSLWVILTGNDLGRGAADQINYHQRVIESFAAQWPSPDFRDYVSATTPLYHVVMAAVRVYVTERVEVQQLLGLAIGLGFLGVVWWFVAGRAPAGLAALLCLPLACSMYVLDSSSWLLPDNAAWALVAVIVGLALRERFTPGMLAVGAGALVVLVLTRQSHLWAAGVLWLGAYLADGWSGRPASAVVPRDRLFSNLANRSARAAIAVGATLPAILIVGYFWRLWGGRLTPPIFDAWYGRRLNPSAPAFLLSLAGVYSVFFAGFLLPALMDLLRRRAWVLALAAGAGALFALATATTYDLSEGRFGGLWNVARKLPAPGGRSVLILALSVGGAVALAGWWAALDFRRRWALLGTICGFITAQVVNPWLFQRYAEPLFLIVFAFGAALIWAREREAGTDVAGAGRIGPGPGEAVAALTSPRGRILRWMRALGLVGLSGLLLVVTLTERRSAKPVVLLPMGAVEAPPTDAP